MNLYGFIGNKSVSSIDFLGLKEQLLTLISGPNGKEFATSDTVYGTRGESYGKDLNLGSGITLADGVGPLGPTTQTLQSILDALLQLWETKNNKKCCHTFKGNSLQSSKINPMTADRAKNLILEWQKKSDQLILLAHGVKSAKEGGETGLLFYKGEANGKAISIGYPIASLVSDEIKELRVLACFDAGIPSKSNGTMIIKIGPNRNEKNSGGFINQAFSKYISDQCDACH